MQALWGLLRRTDTGARDRAVSLLTLALELEPQSALRQNDLSAVLLLRGALDNRPSDWAEALNLADRAARAGLDEAQINRAIALEYLTLTTDAQAAWRDIISSTPPASEIAAFSKRALRSISPGRQSDTSDGSALDAYPVRRNGERLLGAWSHAYLSDEHAAATTLLVEAERVAQQHFRLSGDQLLLDAVGSISAALPHEARSRRLARGHAAYEAARGDKLYADCGRQLDTAATLLGAERSPFAGWAQIDQAICGYYRKDFDSATRRLDQVVTEASSGHRFIALIARARWILGLIRTVEGNFAAAERELSLAAAEFTILREPAHAAYLQSLLAKALENRGERAAAWQSRIRALRSRSRLAAEREWTVLDEAAQSLKRDRLDHAFRFFIDERVRVGEAALARSPLAGDILGSTLLERATLWHRLGMASRSAADLDRAANLIERLPSAYPTRRRQLAEVAAHRALLSASSTAETIKALDDAIALYREASPRSDELEVIHYLRLRADVRRKAGDYTTAEADLREAVAELERQRKNLAAGDQKARFELHAAETYEELLDLLLLQHRTLDALAVVEAMASRWWLENPISGTDPVLSWPRMPADTRVLRYAQFGDRLVTWLLSPHGGELLTATASRRQLDLSIEMCRQELLVWSGDEFFCHRLAALLVPRQLATLSANTRLVFVADFLTGSVPFAALKLPDGHRLVERFRIVLAPSALRPRPSGSSPAAESALFVVDPEFDRQQHPALRPLEVARAASSRFARNYAHSLVLDGAAATKPAVLSGLRRAQIVHFEAHGVDVPDSSGASGILLANAAGSNGTTVLSAGDIGSAAVGDARLVVLAGCATNAQRQPGTLRLSGLATALLGAGVQQVLATGWDIEDQATGAFFTRFHDCYAGRGAADDCLRRAQLSFLGAADPILRRPRAWAAYQLYESAWSSPPESVVAARVHVPSPDRRIIATKGITP